MGYGTFSLCIIEGLIFLSFFSKKEKKKKKKKTTNLKPPENVIFKKNGICYKNIKEMFQKTYNLWSATTIFVNQHLMREKRIMLSVGLLGPGVHYLSVY